MPCLVVVLALVFPRLAIVLLWLFTNFFARAFGSILILLLGFLFLPLTTIVYAYTLNTGHGVEGIYLIAIIVAALADLGFLGGGYQKRRR